MLFGTPTTPEAVMGAILNRVAAFAQISADYVYPSLADDDELSLRPPAEKFVVVRPLDFPARVAEQSGGAGAAFGVANDVPVDGGFSVALFVRLETDAAGRDADYLADQANGVLARWRLVLSALEKFAPTAADGTCILIEPMRLRSFSVRPRKRKGGWGKLESTWLAPFVYDLSPPARQSGGAVGAGLLLTYP